MSLPDFIHGVKGLHHIPYLTISDTDPAICDN